MTDTIPTAPTRRWRTIVFWVLMALLLFLHLGERPQQLVWLVTSFGADLGGHEIHTFAQGVIGWTVIAAVAVNLRHTARQVGAAWVYGLISVLAFAMFLVLADLPPELVPVIAAVLVVGLVAFIAHPSSLRDKFRRTEAASPVLLALLAVAAVPLAVYGLGQLAIHAGSGAGDEHYEFGHWIIMAVYAFTVLPIGLVAALKVSGWRVPAWVTGVMVAGFGVASLGINAVSQLSTPWALAAVAWGVAFVAVAERESRRAATPAPTSPQTTVPA